MIRIVMGILLLMLAVLFLVGMAGMISDTMLTDIIKKAACLMLSIISGVIGIFNLIDARRS